MNEYSSIFLDLSVSVYVSVCIGLCDCVCAHSQLCECICAFILSLCM